MIKRETLMAFDDDSVNVSCIMANSERWTRMNGVWYMIRDQYGREQA